MADVTACDLAIVSRAREIAREKTHPIKMRVAARLIGWVFRVRVALGVSRRVGRSKLTFAFWGRWCGPGYGGGTPVDALDCACKSHDECYSAAGERGRLLRIRWADLVD